MGRIRGRPPVATPFLVTVGARVTKVEQYEVKKAAAAAGLSVSAYLRRKLGLDKEVADGR